MEEALCGNFHPVIMRTFALLVMYLTLHNRLPSDPPVDMVLVPSKEVLVLSLPTVLLVLAKP